MIPTETCKMGPFTITAQEIDKIEPCGKMNLKGVLRDSIQQWTDLKRGEPQASTHIYNSPLLHPVCADCSQVPFPSLSYFISLTLHTLSST